mgnify:CR=1 FL=1
MTVLRTAALLAAAGFLSAAVAFLVRHPFVEITLENCTSEPIEELALQFRADSLEGTLVQRKVVPREVVPFNISARGGGIGYSWEARFSNGRVERSPEEYLSASSRHHCIGEA